MRIAMVLLLSLAFQTAFSQDEPSIRDLKAGKFAADSSFIYELPFSPGKKVFVIQAYESGFSHKGERALDFKVRKGIQICAAREGVVESIRADSDKGGLKPENLSDGNFISIRHDDGSIAHYWHLQKDGVLVQAGDTVQAGQPIGKTGNTGYSAFPHLHFEVLGRDSNGNFTQLATRFRTKKGIRYLRPGHFYRGSRLD